MAWAIDGRRHCTTACGQSEALNMHRFLSDMQWPVARGLVDFLKPMKTCAAVAGAVRIIHRTAALPSCLVPLEQQRVFGADRRDL